MGITPDSGKAPHEYASRGVSELIEAGQGWAGQAHLRPPRMGPQRMVTSGGSSEVEAGRVREVKVAVPART